MVYKTNHQMSKTSLKQLEHSKKYRKSHPDMVKKINDKYQATKREFQAFRKILL